MSKHRDYFNRMAAEWDNFASEEAFTRIRKLVMELAIKPRNVILDAGCGTGILLPLLAKAIGAEGKIIALDISEEMIKRAKAKDLKGNIEYLCADVSAIPLPDEIFDLIICNACFPHFPNKLKALAEMVRVLKQKGQLVIFHSISREMVNELHQSIGGAIEHDLIPDEAEMNLLLSGAGFEGIKVQDNAEDYLVTASKP